MAKVYMKVKRINEDVSITDSTLAQQYLAVKKQMADKRTRRDNLMKQVNQLDSEMNILEKNLIAIEVKSTSAGVKKEEQQKQPKQKPVQPTQPAEPATETTTEANESFKPGSLIPYEEFIEMVIASIDETFHNGEGLAYDYEPLVKKHYKKGESAEDIASMIIQLETDWKDNSVDFNKAREAWSTEESYIGGDNMGKFAANRSTPTRVTESIYDDLTSSIEGEVDTLEKELQKLADIKDFIVNYDSQGVKENPEDVDIDININVDTEEGEDEEFGFDKIPQDFDDYPEEEPESDPELPALPPAIEDEDGMYDEVPEDIADYEDKDYSNISDEIVDTEDRPDPFTPGEEEMLVDETLKAEDKPPFTPSLVEQEDIETELELMNYEDEDEPQDEYVFHVKIDADSDTEIIAKIYREDEDDNWTARVVKGDEEPLQSMEFDHRLDKLDIIGYLADMYTEIEIIDKKEYEYLLDDKEKVDSEYYGDIDES